MYAIGRYAPKGSMLVMLIELQNYTTIVATTSQSHFILQVYRHTHTVVVVVACTDVAQYELILTVPTKWNAVCNTICQITRSPTEAGSAVLALLKGDGVKHRVITIERGLH
jgi:hypothetical protein